MPPEMNRPKTTGIPVDREDPPRTGNSPLIAGPRPAGIALPHSVTLDDAIEFIVAKTELLAEEREQLKKWLNGYDEMWQHPRLSLQQLRSIDGEMLERFKTTPAAEIGRRGRQTRAPARPHRHLPFRFGEERGALVFVELLP